jgi:hypothetical protein
MPKLDIFGGKPLSAYHNTGVARRSTTTDASANFIREFRTGSKDSMIQAFNTMGLQGVEKSSVLSTLSNAWNKVVYSLFKAKTAKKDVGGGKKVVVEVRKNFVSRKGARQSLNTVAYFRARHPKLFRIYVESFNTYLNMSPAQGGVVVSYNPENPGDLVSNKFAIEHYKKFNKYSLTQMQNILRFLKDAHYDKVRDLAVKATNPSKGLGLNRAQSGPLYAPIGGTGYSVMTLYAMFKKLGKSNPGHPAYRVLSSAFSDVPTVAPIKIKGRGMGAAEKDAERARHASEKKSLKSALSRKAGQLDAVAGQVQQAMATANANRSRASSAKKEATAQRFAQIVRQVGADIQYARGVFDRLSPEDKKFANGVVLSVRKRFGARINSSTLGVISNDVSANALRQSGAPAARHAKLSAIKAARRRTGGSLSSSRLSSMGSSSFSSSRDDFSRDESDFSFY